VSEEQQQGPGRDAESSSPRREAQPGESPSTAQAVSVEVILAPPDGQTEMRLGAMDAAGAMALLDLVQGASAIVVEDGNGPAQELPPPTGYVVLVDAAMPGRLAVRTTYTPRGHGRPHAQYEDLGTPGGDSHGGPASIVVLLDHWAEEHGYRFVHTPAQLNQPLDEFIASLGPEDRQRVVIAHEEEDGGLVRIGEAADDGREIFEVAALSMDWIARLPPPR
jgi:hypothetical protein